jgi:hypothetical protein
MGGNIKMDLKELVREGMAVNQITSVQDLMLAYFKCSNKSSDSTCSQVIISLSTELGSFKMRIPMLGILIMSYIIEPGLKLTSTVHSAQCKQ